MASSLDAQVTPAGSGQAPTAGAPAAGGRSRRSASSCGRSPAPASPAPPHADSGGLRRGAPRRLTDVRRHRRRSALPLGGRSQHARRVTSAPALDISGLTVRYGDTLAVDGLDLVVPTGQTVALLGPNGAGKSTTVNAVLGLLPAAIGRIRVLDRTPAEAVRAGGVGAMLQHGGLPSSARVGEVIDLVRRSFPSAWPLDDLVATAGIDGLLGRPVDALSGGQRQRVLLALALAGEPPLLLLDEPTSAMDVEGRRAFWTTMRGLADRGHTVVFATHHLA